MSINKYITFSIRQKSNTGSPVLQLESEDFDVIAKADVSSVEKVQEELKSQEDWTRYVRASILETWNHLGKVNWGPGEWEWRLKSTLPLGCGMSSSAAICCGAVFATSFCMGVELDKVLVAELAQKAEHRLGMMCGLMDQILCCCGAEGMIKFVQFHPTRISSIPFPKDLRIVVCQSLITAKKLETDFYNRRIAECRLGAALIAKYFNDPKYQTNVYRLREILDKFNVNHETIIELLPKIIKQDAYTLGEISNELGLSEEQVKSVYMKGFHLLPSSLKELKCLKRCRHVFSEALRVLKFVDVCQEGLTLESQCNSFTEIYRAAHHSCKHDFETSVPRLDELIQICSEKSYASKFCGAGFGGTVISIIHKDQQDDFFPFVWKNYYQKNYPDPELTPDQCMYITQPSQGLSITKNDN